MTREDLAYGDGGVVVEGGGRGGLSLQSYIWSDGRRLAERQKRLICPLLLLTLWLDEPAQVKPGSRGSTALQRCGQPGCHAAVHAGGDAEPHPLWGIGEQNQNHVCSDSSAVIT